MQDIKETTLKPASANNGSGFFAFCYSPLFSPLATRRSPEMIQSTATIEPPKHHTETTQVNIFLSAPYFHPSQQVREARLWSTEYRIAELRAKGMLIFSPTVLAANTCDNDLFLIDSFLSSKAIKKQINKADRVVVFRLAGWQFSAHVQGDINYANETGKPVEYID